MNRVVLGFGAALGLSEAYRYSPYSVYRTKWFRDVQHQFRIHPTILTITGVNLAVFAAWQVPSLRYTMSRYFSCSSIHSLSKPQIQHYIAWLASTFSHQHLFHLGANMFAFHSFAPVLLSHMDTMTFAQFYISSAFVSSAASLLYKRHMGILSGSLGLSGVLLGMLGYTALKYPTTKVQLMFVPVPFEIINGLYGMMALDIAGILFRWQLFDHVAHLGGAVAGIGYYYYKRYRQPERKRLF